MGTSAFQQGQAFPDGAVTTAKIAAGAVTPAKLSQPLTRGTNATLSGSSVDFTGIPSWVTKITVMMTGASTNASGGIAVQLGTSGGIESTGYNTSWVFVGAALGGMSSGTAQINLTSPSATASDVVAVAVLELRLKDAATNEWVATGHSDVTSSGSEYHMFISSTKTMSGGAVDRVRIMCGANTFDAGSANILYE